MRTNSLHAGLALGVLLGCLVWSTDGVATERVRDDRRIRIEPIGERHSSTHQEVHKSATDTFYVYGGPGTAEGRFQTLEQYPGGAPDPQGWTSVDLTEQTPKWHASTTNSSSTGDGNPEGFTGDVGNHGVISHHAGGDYTGYGNDWNDWLVFGYDLANLGFHPDQDTTTVRLTAEYKHTLEPRFDFLHFEWLRGDAGSYESILAVDGTSYNDATGRYEKRDFDSDEHGGMVYLPGEYPRLSWPGSPPYGIQLRIRVTSDGLWSDGDGLFVSNGRGAAALDNLRVYVNGQLVSLADFEPLGAKDDAAEGSVEGHDNGRVVGSFGWVPTPTTFHGDFAKLFGQFQDIDPCRDNITPAWTFINDGTGANNCNGCPLPPSTSPNWSYGIPGGYVVAFDDGLSGGTQALNNYIWSPEIALDLPGTEDDVTNGGLILGFTRFTHFPLQNGIFAVWKVRYRDSTGELSGWRSDYTYGYSGEPIWENVAVDMTKYVSPDAVSVQVALGVVDVADYYSYPGDDATPSPLYDNVYVKKYRVGGPSFSFREVDLPQDCFPIDGTLTGSCRFDPAISLGGYSISPGDSITVMIEPGIPGAELFDPAVGGMMHVVQLANPGFDSERTAALASLGTVSSSIDPRTGWTLYTYSIPGQARARFNGVEDEISYYFDLPDGQSNGLPHIQDEPGLIFPGDILHFRFESWTTDGDYGYLPEPTGFEDFGPDSTWPRRYSMRALPTVVAGGQPLVLFWNDAGHGESEMAYLEAFQRICIREGREFDTYTTRGAEEPGYSDGIGSAGFRGASPVQMEGYHVLVYSMGDLARTAAISDGTGAWLNDASDDLGLIQAWLAQDAPRHHVYFGDNFAKMMSELQEADCRLFLNTTLGVQYMTESIGPSVQAQLSPRAAPTGDLGTAFVTGFTVDGGCPTLNDFDHVRSFGGLSQTSHEYLDLNENPYTPLVAAGLDWRRTDGDGYIEHSTVFPFDLQSVRSSDPAKRDDVTIRAALLEEVLRNFNVPVFCTPSSTDPDGIPGSASKFRVHQNHPNPFNPRTRIDFSLPRRGEVRITLYNVRGERISVLLDEVREAGPGFVDWNGRDARGAEVASGIYLYKVEAAGQTEIKKMALIR